MMIPVVRSGWISSSLAKNKQAQIRPFSPDPRMIFSNVVLSCADIPPTDKEAIVGATMAMGGTESDNLTKIVTHICALTTDHPKCQTALQKSLKCKIVLPHWFDDCFKLGKRIDEGPYLLPDPEILRVRPEEEIECPPSQHLQGATSTLPDYIPTPADTMAGARPKLTVFNEKKVMLSADLSISQRLRAIVQHLIVEGGGDTTDSVEECDMFICQFRDGDHYVRASQLSKDVGNLSWLYYLITNNEWTSPMRRLLHYPVPRNGIPGMRDFRITLSNYGGEARIYLENLITASGAEFTKTMKADNTHLITARDNSEKCDAARDWNINMINHLWLEESYAKCEVQNLTVAKYTHFPPRTNLGEVIGQTHLDEARLRAVFYPGGPEKTSPVGRRKRKTMDKEQENAASDGPVKGMVIGRQAQKEFDVMKDSEVEYAEKTTEVFGVPAPGKKRPAEFTTPARERRHTRIGKENETPSTVSSSGRSAKEKAIDKLTGLASDIALYEKEKKRGMNVNGVWGGKRAANQIEKQHLNRSSVSSSTEPQDDEGEEDEAPSAGRRPAKRAKHTTKQIEARVILTGFKRWVNDKHKEDADRVSLMHLILGLRKADNLGSGNYESLVSPWPRTAIPVTTWSLPKLCAPSNSFVICPRAPRCSHPVG